MDLSERTNSIFRCLGHPYRRKTVTIVTDLDKPITVDELAREIAKGSDSIRSSHHDSDPVEAIAIELHHCHLPKLADADLIEYDSDADLVSSTPVTTNLTALIQIGYSIAEVM